MNSARLRIAVHAFATLAFCLLNFGCSSERAEMAATPNISQGSQLYDVFLAKRGGSQKKIGQVTVDKEYRLQIVSVIPSQKDSLAETIDAMNAKTELHAEAAPPPGAPPFSDFSRVVDRNSPAFFTQLQAHLKQYYDLILAPAK
jgi:hypothetical protein